MDDSEKPEPFVGTFFKIVFGLLVLVIAITQTPLGGAFGTASAGVYTSVTASLRTNTGNELSLDDGLVGHWTFDGPDMDLSNASAEVLDSSGNNNSGDWIHSATSTVQGVIGQAIDFDGSNDRIDVNTGSELLTIGDITVTAWINKKTTSSSDYILSCSGTPDGPEDNNDTVRFYQSSSGKLNLLWNYGSGSLSTETADDAIATPLGQWAHVAATRDVTNNEVRFYENGVLIGAVETYTNDPTGGINATCQIGANLGSSEFDGSMDDLRVYDRVLSADEMLRLYQQAGGTKIADTIPVVGSLANGLVGHWTFDGPNVNLKSTTAEILDSSGNTNHGDWLNHSTTTVQGVIGQAIDFDGDDDRIDVGNASELLITGDVTVSAWVNRRTTNSSDYIFSCGVSPVGAEANNGIVRLYILSSGKLGMIWNYGAGSTNSEYTDDALSTPLGEWAHVAATRDVTSNEVRFYENGVFIGSVETFADDPTGGSNATCQIGAHLNSSEFDGSMDDLRVYDRVLSADEMLRLYQQAGGTKIADTIPVVGSLANGLVGHWTFDGEDMDWASTTAEVLDRSSGNHHGNASTSIDQTSVAIGIIGQAIEFESGIQCIKTADDVYDFGTDFSVSAWIKPKVLDASIKHYVSKQEGGGYALERNNKKFSFFGWDGTGNRYATSDQDLTTGEWSHLVGLVDGTSVQLYVNGILQATEGVLLSDVTSTNVPLSIGCNPGVVTDSQSSEDFQDDIRVYDRVLSANEVQRIYEGGR